MHWPHLCPNSAILFIVIPIEPKLASSLMKIFRLPVSLRHIHRHCSFVSLFLTNLKLYTFSHRYLKLQMSNKFCNFRETLFHMDSLQFWIECKLHFFIFIFKLTAIINRKKSLLRFRHVTVNWQTT